MQNQYAPIITFLSTGTLLLDILVVLGLIGYFVSLRVKNKSALGKISNFLGENAILLGFVFATFATLSSLFLSEIVKFPPCELCWYQRVFMYPQVVLFGIALWKNDAKVELTSIILSLLGILLAIYHIFLQMYPAILPCTSTEGSCAVIQVQTFGLITIPVMSATAFAAIIVIMLFGLRKK